MTARRCQRWPLLAIAMVAALGARAVWGKSPLSAELRPVPAQCRSGAPIVADVRFNYSGSGLLEGFLDIEVRDGGTVVGRYRSGDLVLTSGGQTFRMMLPAAVLDGWGRWATAKMRFCAAGEVFDLGERGLSLPCDMRRSFVVGVCQSGERSVAQGGLARSLLLDRFDPDPQPASERTYSCFTGTVEPEDLPVHPLGYCCYDLMFLPGEGFGELQAKQLDALRRWVEGGGSACVVPGGGMKSQHVRFLNDLAGKPVFGLDASGRARWADAPPPNGIGMYRCGLGRAVVVLRPSGSSPEVDSAYWRRAVAFLWKVRSNQVSALASEGRWRADLQRDWPTELQHRSGMYDLDLEAAPSFRPVPTDYAGRLCRQLMPEGIRVMPFGVVALVFLLFVLAVGPLDYCVLGFLRRRRYTWVLFPVVSVGFTVFVVQLSNHYMGVGEHHRGFVFVDVGRGGKVLRWSRFALSLSSRERAELTRVQNGLYAQLDQAELLGGPYRYRRPGDFQSGPPPLYLGRIPGDFTVARQLRQWTPLLHRILSFEPVEPAVELDWDAVGPADLRTFGGRRRLGDKLLADRECPGAVFLLHGGDMRHVAGDRDVLSAGLAGGHYGWRGEAEAFLHEACVRSQLGLFSVVAQISPTGGATFDDLSVLDPTDPEQWLLVAVVRSGPDYFVYRRLYGVGEPDGTG